MQIVFVGQQPATVEDEGKPLIVKPNSTGHKIVQWMGVTEQQFNDNFARVNLNPWHDPEEFSPGYCRAAAQNLYGLLYGRRVVLLGPAVAEAFGIMRHSYKYFHFQDHPDQHFLYAVMPHPSGLNRLYNDPAMVAQARQFLGYLWNLSAPEGESLVDLYSE